MGHTGEELGGDCVDIWEAGRYKLKPLAATFRGAAWTLDHTDDGLDNLYRDSLLGGPYGPVRGVWASLRDEVVAILRETAENLDLTGDALLLAAKEYTRTDQEAKRTFDRTIPGVIAANESTGPVR